MNNIILLLGFLMLTAFTPALPSDTGPVLPSSKQMVHVLDNNVLNTVSMRLDSKHNRIYFTTPYIIEGVNITVKDKGRRIILQQKNMKISKEYSISFPPKPNDEEYTVILQKENHIVVERLQKEFL